MSGKGDDRRPSKVDEQTFSDNWERIFTGARLGADTASNSANDGSIPSAPANDDAKDFMLKGIETAMRQIYINSDTGEQVTEDWWPELTR